MSDAANPSTAAIAAVTARGRSSRARWLRPTRVVGSVVVIYIIWSLAATRLPAYLLPAPAAVWDSFLDAFSRGVWTAEVLATLQQMVISFGAVLVIGLPLGILIGRSRIAEDLTRIPLIFLQTVPTIVLIALALIVLGANESSVIAVTIAGSITYFLLNVIQGTRAIDQDLVDMARAYQSRESVIMRSIVLPSVVPYFLAGARVALGVSWQITLFAEYLTGAPGIGFQVSTAIKLLDTKAVFMWGLSVVVLTVIFEYGIFRPVERYLTRHRKEAS
ncbi:MAG: ABC transporter permease [Candidatus Leucobacter sulfamidivorax]|nr:ABC transporter permease [Candidatus Leucobacter sulfamidivorax]